MIYVTYFLALPKFFTDRSPMGRLKVFRISPTKHPNDYGCPKACVPQPWY